MNTATRDFPNNTLYSSFDVQSTIQRLVKHQGNFLLTLDEMLTTHPFFNQRTISLGLALRSHRIHGLLHRLGVAQKLKMDERCLA